MTPLFLASYVGLWMIVLLLSAITLSLVRIVRDSHSQWSRTPSLGLRVGQTIPDVVLQDAQTGEQVPPQALLGRPTLILFTDAACPECHRTAPKLDRYCAAHPADVRGIVICRGDAATARTFAAAAQLDTVRVCFDPAGSTSLAFDVTLTPLAMLFDEKGVLRDKLTASQMDDLEGRLSKGSESIRRLA